MKDLGRHDITDELLARQRDRHTLVRAVRAVCRGRAPRYAAWTAASGAAGSLAAGAVALGYYLVYWIGVRRRVERQ